MTTESIITVGKLRALLSYLPPDLPVVLWLPQPAAPRPHFLASVRDERACGYRMVTLTDEVDAGQAQQRRPAPAAPPNVLCQGVAA